METIKISEIKIGERFRKDLGDLTELKNSIEKIGLLHPVVIDKDKNLKVGLRRLKTLESIYGDEIPLKFFRIVEGLKGKIRKQAEIDENEERKNFTILEKFIITEDARPKVKKEAEKREKAGKPSATVVQGKTNEILGKKVKMSRESLRRTKEIFDSGYEEIIEYLKKTENIKEAYKRLQQKKAQEEKEKQAENYVEKDSIKILHGDFRDISKELKNESVDLILTDPPYPEEFLNLWQDLFEVADRILKPSKFLICYANHQNLDKIFRLNNNLKYYWIFKLDFTLKPIAKGRNLIATWKPVLIYQKLPFKKIEETIEDSIKFDYTERELHDKNWGQTIQPFEYLLEKFSKPNDLIFEPFAGSGTTLMACYNKKRKCIGAETEEKYIDIIKGRLNELYLRTDIKNEE